MRSITTLAENIPSAEENEIAVDYLRILFSKSRGPFISEQNRSANTLKAPPVPVT